MDNITQGQAIHGMPNPRQRGPQPRACSECSNTWMKIVQIEQIQDFQVILGQPAPAVHPGAFYFYECIKCGHLNQPALVYEGQNFERRTYEMVLALVKEKNEANKSK